MWRVFSKASGVGVKWGCWRVNLKNSRALRPFEWAAKRRPRTFSTRVEERGVVCGRCWRSVGCSGWSGNGWSLMILVIRSISEDWVVVENNKASLSEIPGNLSHLFNFFARSILWYWIFNSDGGRVQARGHATYLNFLGPWNLGPSTFARSSSNIRALT